MMITVWVIAMIVFLIVEGVTLGLTSLWFAFGSLAALISAMFGAPTWMQVVWFLVISGAALAATRPLAKKYLNSKCQPTNADLVIGASGIVTETIDNLHATGAVSVGGKIWTARSQDESVIEANTEIRVEAIHGVKLIVTAIQQTQK